LKFYQVIDLLIADTVKDESSELNFLFYFYFSFDLFFIFQFLELRIRVRVMSKSNEIIQLHQMTQSQ